MRVMQIRDNVSLKDFSSMRLGGNGRHLIEIESKDDLKSALTWINHKQLPSIMIGGGFNIIWKDEGFNGTVLVNKIKGIKTEEIDQNKIKVTLGAGEDWDNIVQKFTYEGFSGIESLSLIPGTCGASPIQNIGAYGHALSDVIESLEAYDKTTGQFVVLDRSECEFGYRSSRFKYKDKNRFLITAITIILEKKNPSTPYYESIEKYITDNKLSGDITPTILREIVIAIRTSTLPDPKVIANTGSFFKNPIINKRDFDNLILKFPEMKHWVISPEMIKLSAGWLIDNVGYRHKYDHDRFDPGTGIATWSLQRLILVNRAAKTTSDLLKFRNEIVSKVKDKFGILIEQEPELLP
jgi:UDP-N-acetylmuramate dehydrogenase